MTSTQTLVRFAHGLTLRDIPATVQHKLKLHVLDAIGCGWAASSTALADQAQRAAELLGGRGAAQVFGTRARHTPGAAALANGLIINALDHDDGVEINGKGLGHPGASLIPAAMAALDQAKGPVAGERVLTALAAGFEINNRLILAQQPTAERFAQVYGVGQHQAIGSAIVYGLIQGFDPQRLHNALGLAATLAPVPSLHKYNWDERPLVTLKDGVAAAAQAGVQAACMTQLGFVGSRDVLDGEQGYWRMAGSDRFAEPVLVNDLGRHWYISYGRFKRYPACRWMASALECMEQIMQQSNWSAQDIEHISVDSFSRLVEHFVDRTPRNPTDAQFSLPYALAAIALRLAPGEAWYSPANWHAPSLQALMHKVSVHSDKDFEARMCGEARQPGARVTVRHRDGRRLSRERTAPSGDFSDNEVIAKASLGMAAKVSRHKTLVQSILGEQRWCADFHAAADLAGTAATHATLVKDDEAGRLNASNYSD